MCKTCIPLSSFFAEPFVSPRAAALDARNFYFSWVLVKINLCFKEKCIFLFDCLTQKFFKIQLLNAAEKCPDSVFSNTQGTIELL